METGELLNDIGNESAVVVVEHDMEFVRQFARKITVLHEGRVISEGSVETVGSDQRVVKAYLGRSRALQSNTGN